MEETIQTIVATLDANNGAMSWNTMLEAVPFQLRRNVVPALAQLKADGIARRQVRYHPEVGAVFEIVRIVS